jgi:hypothetical protein
MIWASDNARRPANGLVMLFFASLVLIMQGSDPVWAQQPSLPAVNLGDTSFLDGIAYPGWVVELIGQGVNDNKTADNTGHVLPESTDVKMEQPLTHIAWLSLLAIWELGTGRRWFSLLPTWTQAAIKWAMASGM